MFGLVRAGAYGPDPAHERVSLAFTTSQAVRHAGRARGYRNEVLSLRLDAAVGSCAVEPGTLPEGALDDCVGARVADLLGHPVLPVRIAALDAYLAHVRPHTPDNGARPYALPAGGSLSRSRARARAVVDLLGAHTGAGPRTDADDRAATDTHARRFGERRPVLVVGVVNSLLEQLRSRGVDYLPCDLKGGTTEWGEPVLTDTPAHLERCGAILASGMTLGNGSFQGLLDHAAATGKPLVMFAQTGSAVLPRFLGAGVSAVSAEPYPFFWLDGGPGTIHRYGDSA
ncbi:Rossmann-like domain-containing protein [Streptomyces sp. NPDC005017]|uniref:Rossmann-like domain-containing protein n=1 Tax=Streptomyces sp. NPDC005017 TaxID=3364706 RepID=UPI00368DFD7E